MRSVLFSYETIKVLNSKKIYVLCISSFVIKKNSLLSQYSNLSFSSNRKKREMIDKICFN